MLAGYLRERLYGYCKTANQFRWICWVGGELGFNPLRLRLCLACRIAEVFNCHAITLPKDAFVGSVLAAIRSLRRRPRNVCIQRHGSKLSTLVSTYPKRTTSVSQAALAIGWSSFFEMFLKQALYLVIFDLHQYCKVRQVITAAVSPAAGIVDNSATFFWPRPIVRTP